MRIFLYIVGALVAGIVAGVCTGGALVLFAPCRWFGSSFEGACGYGGVFTGLMLGVAVAFITAISILVYLLRRDRTEESAAAFPPQARRLLVVWGIMLFFMQSGGLAVISGEFGDLVQSGAGLVGMVVYFGLSAALARAIGKHPAIALTSLVPLFGPLLTAVALFWKPITGQIKPEGNASTMGPSDPSEIGVGPT